MRLLPSACGLALFATVALASSAADPHLSSFQAGDYIARQQDAVNLPAVNGASNEAGNRLPLQLTPVGALSGGEAVMRGFKAQDSCSSEGKVYCAGQCAGKSSGDDCCGQDGNYIYTCPYPSTCTADWRTSSTGCYTAPTPAPASCADQGKVSCGGQCAGKSSLDDCCGVEGDYIYTCPAPSTCTADWRTNSKGCYTAPTPAPAPAGCGSGQKACGSRCIATGEDCCGTKGTTTYWCDAGYSCFTDSSGNYKCQLSSSNNNNGDASGESDDGSTTTGVVVGVLVSVAALVVIIALVIWCVRRNNETVTKVREELNKVSQDALAATKSDPEASPAPAAGELQHETSSYPVVMGAPVSTDPFHQPPPPPGPAFPPLGYYQQQSSFYVPQPEAPPSPSAPPGPPMPPGQVEYTDNTRV